jgi:hypothetical protein
VQCRIFWKEEGTERVVRYNSTGYDMKHGIEEGWYRGFGPSGLLIKKTEVLNTPC